VSRPPGFTVPFNVAVDVLTTDAEPVATVGPAAGVEVAPVLPVEASSVAFAADATAADADPLGGDEPVPPDPAPPLEPVPEEPVPVELPEPVVELPEPVVELPEPVVELPEPVVELPEPVVELPEEVALEGGKPSFASLASWAFAVARAVLSALSCCSSVANVCLACRRLTVFA
jgi:hypothetical protein